MHSVRHRVKTEASKLKTDKYRCYLGISRFLLHSVFKYQETKVGGDTHTITIEGF